MKPSPLTLKLCIAWSILALLMAIFSESGVMSGLWKFSSAFFLCALIIDGIRCLRCAPPEIIRHHQDNLAIGVWSVIEIRIHHAFQTRTTLEIYDHHPPQCLAENPRQLGILVPDQGLLFHYRIKPLQRGNHHFSHLDLLLTSDFGLWQRKMRVGEPSSIKVFPNFAAVSQYALLATEQQSAQIGIRKQQRRGEGLDFHQLREFRQGDSLRQIDWNVSARLRTLISKEYQDEKDQEIFFLIDCGRRMRSQDGDHSHLDHALNAMLLMSYAALKQGDAIGLMSFGGQSRWLKPVKSTACMSRILNQTYDLEASQHASDYSTTVKQFFSRQKKRALVVLLSCIRDENNDDLSTALHLLQRKHLVLVANLEEPEIERLPQQPVQTFEDALRYSGVIKYQEQRRQVTRQLNLAGIATVNCTPRNMAVALVNKYFEIKRKGLL